MTTSNSFVRVPPDSSGKSIATDSVDGKEHQLVKLAFGQTGEATMVANVDGERLPVSSRPSLMDQVVGSISANGGTVAINTERASNMMLHCYGVFSAVNCVFEGSLNSTNGTDGNWFSLQAVRSNANTVETSTGALSSTPTYGWEMSVNGLRWIRVRATSYTSGTQNWILQPAPYATEPIPAIQSGTTSYATPSPNSGFGAGSHYSLVSAASTNAAFVKSSAANVASLEVCNTSASPRYLKLFNKASAPVPGTDTPVKNIMIPPGQTISVAVGPFGWRFATGLGIAITANAAALDATAVAAGDVIVNISYS